MDGLHWNRSISYDCMYDFLSGPSEKPDWSKVKEERQALREKRRAAERDADSYEVSIQAKKVLESIRSRKCPAAEQSKQLDTLYSLLKGKLLSVSIYELH